MSRVIQDFVLCHKKIKNIEKNSRKALDKIHGKVYNIWVNFPKE